MNSLRSYLEKLSIVKTQQHIDKENSMAIIGATQTATPMTTGVETTNPAQFTPQTGPTTTLPGAPTPVNTNPWSDPVTKQNLTAQRLVYSNAVVDLNNKKQALLDQIAQVEDTLTFTLKQINDLDIKIKS